MPCQRTRDSLAIDQAGLNRQLSNGGRGEGEAIGEVIAPAGVQGDPLRIAFGEDAEAVVLDLVNPARPSRWRLGGARQTQLKAPQLALQGAASLGALSARAPTYRAGAFGLRRI